MNGVLRSWCCLNARCKAQFDAWDPNPECPQCGCVRVSWIPGGGHVASMRGIDAQVRQLASSYGMKDINSASPSRLAPSPTQPSRRNRWDRPASTRSQPAPASAASAAAKKVKNLTG